MYTNMVKSSQRSHIMICMQSYHGGLQISIIFNLSFSRERAKINRPYCSLADVIAGKDGNGKDVSLDSKSPMDLSGVESKLPSKLSGVYMDRSYRFKGSSTSYIQIPKIPMDNEYTIVSFIKPETDGPIFQWDAPGGWGDHFWVIKTESDYQLFFRPMSLTYALGKDIRIGE